MEHLRAGNDLYLGGAAEFARVAMRGAKVDGELPRRQGMHFALDKPLQRSIGHAPTRRGLVRARGWTPPNDRAPFDRDGHLILDNYAGEDFLSMHRQMIAEVNELLHHHGEPPIARWEQIPHPGDSEFPVPPAWQYADPQLTPEQNQQRTAGLRRAKSDEFFRDVLAVWEKYYGQARILSALSLGPWATSWR